MSYDSIVYTQNRVGGTLCVNRGISFDVRFFKKFEIHFSELNERLLKLEEQSQQILRQERRRQAAIESIFDNQQKILEVLKSSRAPSSLGALMALAENLGSVSK